MWWMILAPVVAVALALVVDWRRGSPRRDGTDDQVRDAGYGEHTAWAESARRAGPGGNVGV